MNELYEPLSPRGQDRSREILSLAIRAGALRRRHRMIVRSAILGVAMFVLIAVGVIAMGWRERHAEMIAKRLPPPAGAAIQALAPASPRSNEIVIERIATDSRLADKWAAPPSAIPVQRIDDDHLLDELASAHVPASLAYVDGHGRLLYRDTPPQKR